MIAYDVYSETNPAFGAYALVAFASAYISIDDRGPEAPLAYLALPLSLSGDIAGTFEGTNKNTGLLVWLERHPRIQVGFAARANACLEMVTETIRLSCFTEVIELNGVARLQLGSKKFQKNASRALSREPAQAIRHSQRLGYWFAATGSTRAVFDMMGLTA
jgi:hypothetical protein